MGLSWGVEVERGRVRSTRELKLDEATVLVLNVDSEEPLSGGLEAGPNTGFTIRCTLCSTGTGQPTAGSVGLTWTEPVTLVCPVPSSISSDVSSATQLLLLSSSGLCSIPSRPHSISLCLCSISFLWSSRKVLGCATIRAGDGRGEEGEGRDEEGEGRGVKLEGGCVSACAHVHMSH